MRAFIVILILAGLGGVYLLQKAPQHESVAAPPAVAQSSPSAGASASPKPEVSEHNWMKRSLDRARDVAEQARRKTSDSQDP